MRWWRSSTAREPVPAAEPPGGQRCLEAADVVLLYTELLGRPPSDEEVGHQLGAALDLRALLQAILVSPEYRGRRDHPPMPALPSIVNVWHEDLAALGHQAGTWSDDGVAVMGREGWVFLGSGTNAVLDQYRGAFELPSGWRDEWARIVEHRRDGCRRLGAELAAVIVPDKLAVLREHMPEPLPTDVVPPALRLARDPQLGILYPVRELAGVEAGPYLRTDTHLSFAGNAALARAVVAEVGVAWAPAGAEADLVEHLMSGDLGSRFLPPVVEAARVAASFGDATLVEDNDAEVRAVGGHIGIRRVLRNDIAPDARTVVLFGDSYGFPSPGYQGLAWFLAQVFREVHSVWVPFGWDAGYVERAGAEVVICEAAERFVVRPPALEVDAEALAAETIARRRGLLVDELDASSA